MEALGGIGILVLLVVVFLGMGAWIFAGLMLVSFFGLYMVVGMPVQRIGAVMANVMWTSASGWELAAIPLFIWMGEIIYRSDISERLFRGLSPWVYFIPGRLLHTNVVGCTIFAAMSGSSVATTATIGKITVPALIERKYDLNLTLGSIAGAGSFGLMIPPSINMIVYGILTEQSVAKLFAAGILPGLMLAGLYCGYIALRCWLKPSLAPEAAALPTSTVLLRGLWDLVPVLLLILVVLGSIYTGLATPSESAAMGLFGALVLVGAMRQLTLSLVWETLLGAVRSSAMIISILAAATFLSSAFGYMHVTQDLSRAMARFDLSPYELILIFSIFYIILGILLDGLSIIVMSLPITYPIAVAHGIDPIWFGVFLVVMAEISQVTPPIGFNMFVLQGITGESLSRVSIAAFPFCLLLCLGVMILTLFPSIATWLPSVLY